MITSNKRKSVEDVATFGGNLCSAFATAIESSQITLDDGVAANWMEIDFDIRAGSANRLEPVVPKEVSACEGFEAGVLARDRACDGLDCVCC